VAKRCVVLHGDGSVTLASGKPDQYYDLDAALQKGATIVEKLFIGSGTSALLIILEK